LADGTGARDERDEGDRLLETYAQSTATLGLTSRDNATPPLHAQGQPCCNGHRRCHTLAVVAITSPKAPGDAAIPTHAQTAEHLFTVVPPVFARPVGRSRRPRRVRGVLIGPIEGKRGGVLRPPGRRDGIHFQGLQGERATPPMAIGRKQRLQARPSSVIMEGGTREPRLQPREQATLFQPFSYFVERMMPIQNGEDHGFGPTPT
jgi:hypothetical protein